MPANATLPSRRAGRWTSVLLSAGLITAGLSTGLVLAPTATAAPGLAGHVVAWGKGDLGQSTVPPAAQSGVTAISAGEQDSFALTAAGAVVGWGAGYPDQSAIPDEARSGVAALDAGAYHVLALTDDGGVVGWGQDNYGQATAPSDAQSDVIAVAAGGHHSLALKDDGSVVAWGDTAHGATVVPDEVQGSVTAVAAGAYFSLALTEGGRVVAWGNGFYGQTTVPTSAQSGVVAIDAGFFHSLALKEDGSLVAWGQSTAGQTLVPGTAQGAFTDIAAGNFHNLALRADGTVATWGADDFGTSTVPPAAQSDVVAVAAGGQHSLALVDPTSPATIAASNGEMSFHGQVPDLDWTVTGLADGEALTTEPTCTTTATTTSDVGQYPITCTGATLAGYYFDYEPGTLTVTPATATIAATDKTARYRDATPDLDWTVRGLADGEILTTDPTCTTTATPTSDVGHYPITCGGAALAGYDFHYEPGILTIGQAAGNVTVTAASLRLPFGKAMPTPAYTVAGLLEGDTLTAVPRCSVEGSQRRLGSFAHVCSGADAGGGYRLDQVAGTVTIVKAPTTLRLRALSRVRATPMATLVRRHDQLPMAGRVIRFHTNGKLVCRDRTDTDGIATCGHRVKVTRTLRASFASVPGAPRYLGDRDTTPAVRR